METLTLQQIDQQTASLFRKNKLIANPQEHLRLLGFRWDKHINGGLPRQVAQARFDCRCAQLDSIGFVRITYRQAVDILAGEKHNNDIEGRERENHEWVWLHNKNEILVGENCTWGGKPRIYRRITSVPRARFLSLAWLARMLHRRDRRGVETVQWAYRWGNLDKCLKHMPPRVMTIIDNVKEHRLFNCFSLIAPIEAWPAGRTGQEDDFEGKVMLVGSVWLLPPNTNTSGEEQHYYLACF